MVNETGKKPLTGLSTRAYILSQLRKNPGVPAAGEKLAKGAGVSRVAVWKAARSLAEAGYPVVSGKGGYRLRSTESDYLYPWEFGDKEDHFLYYPATDSTMDRARECALAGVSGGTIICAGTQTAGRGRNGKKWTSRKGGLFFTILERPKLSIINYTLLSMAAHIAAGRALGKICGKEAFLRWPNDVYIDGKKAGGLLSELYGEGDSVQWMAIGAGINVNNPVPGGASGCAAVLGRAVSRRDVLLAILDEFGKIKRAASDPIKIRDLWNYHAEGTGSRAIFTGACTFRNESRSGGNILARGIFLGVDYSGRCMLETEREIVGFSPAQGSLIFY
ncbi:MAG: biotin--[acetyl-CoA-carboxylase] ligase [Treponema sp.]|nr:biotin--[acetyl-CoA-carboxylase] ligase [Treponema sp.]